MSLNVVQALRSKPGHEAARLIGIAPQHITDSNFINMLNQYDYNNKKKKRTTSSTDAFGATTNGAFSGRGCKAPFRGNTPSALGRLLECKFALEDLTSSGEKKRRTS